MNYLDPYSMWRQPFQRALVYVYLVYTCILGLIHVQFLWHEPGPSHIEPPISFQINNNSVQILFLGDLIKLVMILH